MRYVFDFALVISALFLPFWCMPVIAMSGLIYISEWYEMAAIIGIFELLFQGVIPPGAMFLYGVPLPIYALLAILLSDWLRTRLRNQGI